MKVLVLCGGSSTERDISITSGTMVCKALRENGHNAVLVDVIEDATLNEFDEGMATDYNVEAAAEKYRALNNKIWSKVRNNQIKQLVGKNILELANEADIVFLALHGSNGEDGRLQAMFDLFGICYTGAGYLSSAMSMDKTIAKEIVKAYGVPVPKGITISKEDFLKDKSKYTLDELSFTSRVVVKPECGGSSVGVTFANGEEEFKKGLKLAFTYEDNAVVEKYVGGREFSVGVIEGKALPIIEIIPEPGTFYDYENKYNGKPQEVCPAELSVEDTKAMQQYAEKSAKALGLKDYCRIDFLMDKKNNMYFLEANTLPGMTPTSLLPQEAAQVGMNFNELCEKIIKIAQSKED
ncbi:MAG: D-alanine--D-alanine ligase [Lachnospiraceae bacterium]|nr:D-alanine--D-alanine ligase [Lachnospiraceae bacterium]